MANKITKKDLFKMLLAEEVVSANPLYVDFITHEIELLNKKSGSKKATKNQVANEGIKATILETLADGCKTISDMIKSNAELSELTNQKVSALVRQLVADGLVVRTTEKKVAYFSLAENSAEEEEEVEEFDEEVTE